MELLSRYLPVTAALLLFACDSHRDPGTGQGAVGARPRHVEKPPSVCQDSLRITGPAAVFFYPDSRQLETVQNTLDTNVYKAIMHDYYYQMRNAGNVVRESWPGLHAVTVKNHRYLLFVKNDGSRRCIDLEKVKDLYGLCLFDGKNDPAFVDLPNVTTALGRYFKNAQSTTPQSITKIRTR